MRQWLPDRQLVIVGDSAYAVLDFLHACQQLPQPVTVITRLRLDAALYAPAPAYTGRGRPRVKGQRLPSPQQVLVNPLTHWQRLTLPWYDHQPRQLDVTTVTALWYHSGRQVVAMRYVLIRDPAGKFLPQALLSTDLSLAPDQILAFFIRRWPMESTFQQARTHLGVETQRQWSDKAIARTTPALLGLFSVITVCAHSLITTDGLTTPATAWYVKSLPTFSDALALVRARLWSHFTFNMSRSDPDMVQIPRALLERFTDLLCYAA